MEKPNTDTYFKDGRGEIITLEDGIQFITSNPLSERASHYHRSSGHIIILTEGSLNYFERPIGSKEIGVKTTYDAPCIFKTDPMIEHLMVFLSKSSMICIRTGGSMTKEAYENDLVRVIW